MEKFNTNKLLFAILLVLLFLAFYIIQKPSGNESSSDNVENVEKFKSDEDVSDEIFGNIDTDDFTIKSDEEIDPSDEQTSNLDLHVSAVDVSSISFTNEYVCYKEIDNGKTRRYPNGKYEVSTFQFFRDQAEVLIAGQPTLEKKYYTNQNLSDIDLIGAQNVTPFKSFYVGGKNALGEIVYYYGYKGDGRNIEEFLFATPDFQMYKIANLRKKTVEFYRTRYYNRKTYR